MSDEIKIFSAGPKKPENTTSQAYTPIKDQTKADISIAQTANNIVSPATDKMNADLKLNEVKIANINTVDNKNTIVALGPNTSLASPATDKINADLKLNEVKIANINTVDNKNTTIALGPNTSLNKNQAIDFYKTNDGKSLGPSNMLQTINQNKGSSKQILANMSLLEESLRAEKLKKLAGKLSTIKIVALVSFLVAALVNGFFYYQIKEGINLAGLMQIKFENNLVGQANQINSDLMAVKTEINKHNYLSGQIKVIELGMESARFIDAVDGVFQNRDLSLRAAADNNLSRTLESIPTKIAEVKKYLTISLVTDAIPTDFNLNAADNTDTKASIELKKLLIKEKENLTKEKGKILEEQKNKKEISEEDKKNTIEIDEELAFLDNVISTVGNTNLVTELKNVNIEEFKKDLEVAKMQPKGAEAAKIRKTLHNVLSSSKANLTLINKIKEKRLKWTEVIGAIKRLTANVDTLNGDSLTEYTGFNFDSRNQSIWVNGKNKTSSGENRQIMASLINDFEDDAYFKEVSNRTFPLSKKDEETGTYSMDFKMEFKIDPNRFAADENSKKEKNSVKTIRNQNLPTNPLIENSTSSPDNFFL